MKKKELLMLVLIMALLLCPSVAFAKNDSKNIHIEKNATETQKLFIEKIAEIHAQSSSDAETQKCLAELGLQADKTYVQKIRIDTVDGNKVPVIVEEKEYPGFYDITSEVGILAGNYSDLTMVCYVNRGYDEVYGDSWISLDYKYSWSSTEWINGTRDGWACNWDTEEAYRVGQGCDSDMQIVKSSIGAFL